VDRYASCRGDSRDVLVQSFDPAVARFPLPTAGRSRCVKGGRRELNLTRGKPATEQIALSDALLTAVTGRADCLAEDGTDCTNYYGSPQGLIETRRLFAPIMGAPPEQMLIGNNSSLALMHAAGLGLFAASPTNMAWYLKRLASRTIGPDKLNQLRHARLFGAATAIDRHMQR
jgi:hypothetical protein